MHLTETYAATEPPLITNVETTTATVTDNEVIEAIHHQALAARHLLPQTHIVDTGYVDARGLVTAATNYQVNMLGPVHADTNWQARQGRGFAAAEFDIQCAAQRVMCPQGHPSAYWRARCDHTGHDIVDVGWSWKTCKVCPVRGECTQKKKGARTLKLRNEAEYVVLQAARQRQRTAVFRGQYRHLPGSKERWHRRFG